ncbi:photosystem II protein Psb27 [Phormidium sp. CLA17]|nr:photosystem II protein Psb27 [Leptolyngbya sp. Cla-17]
MKRYWSRFFALLLVLFVGLVNSPAAFASSTSLTGNYRQDTVSVVNSLREALQVSPDSPEKIASQNQAKQLINDFSSRYRRNGALAKLPSFTTMRTALNSLAGHYSSYPNRPVPQKMKDRLEQEFKQIETSLERGS